MYLKYRMFYIYLINDYIYIYAMTGEGVTFTVSRNRLSRRHGIIC